MFDKKELLKKVIERAEENLRLLVQVAHEARDAATHEDAKAENKYDTRGLEASYLAGAQAKRARALQDSIDILKKIEIKNYMDGVPIQGLALVQLLAEDGGEKWFFILPSQGGAVVEIEGVSIQVLTPDAPLGQAMYGKTTGDTVKIDVRREKLEYEIGEVW